MPTVTVAAPLCAPNRFLVEMRVRDQLKQYHFASPNVHAREEKGDSGNPNHWRIDVGFSSAAAKWGEYVLLRYGYELLSKPLDPRNIDWANRHLGSSCPHGWYEPDCKNPPKGARISGLAPIKTSNPPKPWDVSRKEQNGNPLPGWLKQLRKLL